MTPSVQLSHYTWLKALISDAMNPRFSQMKTNSLTQHAQSWWLRHLHLVWIIRLVNLWVSFSGTLTKDEHVTQVFIHSISANIHIIYMEERLGCLESLLPCMYATAPLTLLTVSRLWHHSKAALPGLPLNFKLLNIFSFTIFSLLAWI